MRRERRQEETVQNTPGTAGRPGGRDRTLAVKAEKTSEKSSPRKTHATDLIISKGGHP